MKEQSVKVIEISSISVGKMPTSRRKKGGSPRSNENQSPSSRSRSGANSPETMDEYEGVYGDYTNALAKPSISALPTSSNVKTVHRNGILARRNYKSQLQTIRSNQPMDDITKPPEKEKSSFWAKITKQPETRSRMTSLDGSSTTRRSNRPQSENGYLPHVTVSWQNLQRPPPTLHTTTKQTIRSGGKKGKTKTKKSGTTKENKSKNDQKKKSKST